MPTLAFSEMAVCQPLQRERHFANKTRLRRAVVAAFLFLV